jgi:hypothetical protein
MRTIPAEWANVNIYLVTVSPSGPFGGFTDRPFSGAQPTPEWAGCGSGEGCFMAVRRPRHDERYPGFFHVMRFLLLRAGRAYAERYIAWWTAAPRLKLLPQRDAELFLSTFSRVGIPPALLLDSTNQWPHRL